MPNVFAICWVPRKIYMTVSEYLERLLAHAGLDDIKMEESEDEEKITINLTVPEDEVGVLIGHHAETLLAVQRVVRLVFRDEVTKKIIINVNDYRERRMERIAEIANEIAERVLETGRPYNFGYLPSHERYVVHATISANPDFSTLETVSHGEGRERRLTVQLKSDVAVN